MVGDDVALLGVKHDTRACAAGTTGFFNVVRQVKEAPEERTLHERSSLELDGLSVEAAVAIEPAVHQTVASLCDVSPDAVTIVGFDPRGRARRLAAGRVRMIILVVAGREIAWSDDRASARVLVGGRCEAGAGARVDDDDRAARVPHERGRAWHLAGRQ